MPTIAKTQPDMWWLDSGNIARLYRYLTDTGALDAENTNDVAYFISKPWKWNGEYAAMCQAENDGLAPLLEASIAAARGAKGAR